MATTKIPAKAVKRVNVIFNFSFKVKMTILFAVACCFYINTLSNVYALDDEAVITSNAYVQKGFSGIGKILTTDAYDSYYRQNNSNQHLSGGRYRPLSIALFAIEHQLWGESPVARHLINVVLYILCILSIFYFLSKYLLGKIPYGEDIAFVATLLFIIHPIHTEVVANVKSSDEILSFLFIMLTFIFSIRYRESKKLKHLIVAIGSLFLALLAKEYAVTLIFLLPLLFVVYFKENILQSVKSSLSYYAVIVFYFIIRIASIGFVVQYKELDILNNPYMLATSAQSLASKVFILGRYIYMLFVPYPLASDYGFAQIPYHNFSSLWVWLSIIIYGITIYAVVRLFRKKNVFSFPIFFFLFNLFMVSNLIINIGATMGERLAFHASLGFVIILAWGIINLVKSFPANFRAICVGGLLTLLIIVSGIEVLNRNRDWKNNFTLFTKDVNTVPNSVKANDNAGAQYINQSELIKDTALSDSVVYKGLKYLYKAIQLDDSDMDGYLNLGIAYCKLVEPDSAKHYWDIARKIYAGQPNLPSYYSLLGQIFTYTGKQLAMKHKYDEAIHEFKTGIECNPMNADLWINMGGTFFNTHQYDSAYHDWRKAQAINPDYPNLKQYFNMLPKPFQDSNTSPGFK